MRFNALVPLACAIVTFVLALLCLFAGTQRNFMEDYHIATVNTSTLGHWVLPNSTTNAAPQESSITSWITGQISNITASIQSEMYAIEGDVADRLSGAIGIRQWYSLHVMEYCEGTYSPNATAKTATPNVTMCSNQTAMYHFNFSAILQKELSTGMLGLNLADINYPPELQKKLNRLTKAFEALFVFYIIAIAAAGLGIIAAVCALFLHAPLYTWLNLGLASLTFVALLMASAVVTEAQIEFVGSVNAYGNDMGAYAKKGGKYLALTWSTVAVMGISVLVWAREGCLARRAKKRALPEKGRRIAVDEDFAKIRVKSEKVWKA